MQKITVIGTGYVGLIAGLGFAKWGNEVVCLDVVPEKIEKLQRGVCPIYEPGAETQLSDGLQSGRLRFTCDVKEAVEHGDLIFIAVGTPPTPPSSRLCGKTRKGSPASCWITVSWPRGCTSRSWTIPPIAGEFSDKGGKYHVPQTGAYRKNSEQNAAHGRLRLGLCRSAAGGG